MERIRASLDGFKNLVSHAITYVAGADESDQMSYVSSCEEVSCKSDCSACDSENRPISLPSSKNSNVFVQNSKSRSSLQNSFQDEDKENNDAFMSNGGQSRKRLRHNHQNCSHDNGGENRMIDLSSDRKSVVSQLIQELNQNEVKRTSEEYILRDITNQKSQKGNSSQRKRKFDEISCNSEQKVQVDNSLQQIMQKLDDSAQTSFDNILRKKEDQALRRKQDQVQNLKQNVDQLQQNFGNLFLNQTFNGQNLDSDQKKIRSLQIAVLNPSEKFSSSSRHQQRNTFAQSSAFLRTNAHNGLKRELLNLENLKISSMTLQKIFECISENPVMKYEQQVSTGSLEYSNQVTSLNESLISSRDPDFFKVSQHIDLNKNYLEIILNSLVSLPKRNLFEQCTTNIFDEKIVSNSKAKYQLSLCSISMLLQRENLNSEITNSYFKLIEQRDRETGQNYIKIFDSLLYPILENILLQEDHKKRFSDFCEKNGKQLKNFKLLAIPVTIANDQQFVVIADISENQFTIYNLTPTSSEDIDKVMKVLNTFLTQAFTLNQQGRFNQSCVDETSKWKINQVNIYQIVPFSLSNLTICYFIEQLSLVPDVTKVKFSEFSCSDVQDEVRKRILIELIFGQILTELN
eukprot:403373252